MAKQPLIAKEILERYKAGTCTPEEKVLVEQWYETIETPDYNLSDSDTEKALAQAWQNIQSVKQRQRPIKLWRMIGVAAAIVLVCAVAIRIYLSQYKATDGTQTTITIDVAPGRNKATLTLADGRKISLTDAVKGQLAEQSGVAISKTAEGQISYEDNGGEAGNTYNTIETPRGGEFRVVLPDGSKVWINAASSLRYPATFTGAKVRNVELTGEAYFEVAHDASKPFRVISEGQMVEVLGTHFNVNSYANEGKTVTTLAEGSVKVLRDIANPVHSKKQSLTIIPGQQAINTNEKLTAQPADLETTLAWKNGFIYFRKADLKTIMRQVERWYDIDVSFKGAIPNRRFTGGIARTSNLSALLNILQENDIHFIVNHTSRGKQLIVEP